MDCDKNFSPLWNPISKKKKKKLMIREQNGDQALQQVGSMHVHNMKTTDQNCVSIALAFPHTRQQI